MPLPVSILLPTRNSAGLLPGHLPMLAALAPLVEEVVQVDSRSQDGTLRLVREGLPAARLRVFDHPPGLYQSWNHGLQQITAEFTYISTVGDGISPAGLRRLHEVARRLDADVVISVPTFLRASGRPVRLDWPVQRVIRELRLSGPTALSPAVSFLLAALCIPDALLSSSASNLYRTRVLQERPFPVDYGFAGDTAWALQHALHVRMAILPESLSTFLLHEKTYSQAPYQVADNRGRMVQAARRAAGLDDPAGASVRFPLPVVDTCLKPFFASLAREHACQDRLEFRRHACPLPWVLYPDAWQARWQRNRHRRRALRLLRQMLSLPEITGPPQS